MININNFSDKNDFMYCIKEGIVNSDPASLVELMGKNINYALSFDDIAKFLLSLTSCESFSPRIVLSGSGGSGIVKPNITSLCSLYLACAGVPIIKVGGYAHRGYYGSADFFRDLQILNKTCITTEIKFACYSTDYFTPWRKYSSVLALNESFRAFFNSCIVHEVSSGVKIVGVLGKKAQEEYLSKQHFNMPSSLLFLYSNIAGGVIDELVPWDPWFQNKQVRTKKIPYDSIEPTQIMEINKGLIEGNCKSEFWTESLFLTFCCAMMTLAPTKKFSDCYSMAEYIYKNQQVKELIELMRRETG